MARFEVSGIADLCNDLASLAELPDSVTDDILNAEADVIVDAQRRTMERMLKGRYSTGDTARSIKKGKIKKGKDGKCISVSPQGTNRRGERNAAVAFINEYGKRGQPARPAIRTANAEAESAAIEAGEKVYHAYLDSKKL
ncbi:MAG: hypothetical protein K2N78_07875 [Oscillospiraceae bacterium]|nr:hypothetical protein [Oscillospiraceae bacterium]